MKCYRDLSKKKKKIKNINSKMATNSQLSRTEHKSKTTTTTTTKKTKQTSRSGTESQKWRSHGGLSAGRWKREDGEKGIGNKKHKW